MYPRAPVCFQYAYNINYAFLLFFHNLNQFVSRDMLFGYEQFVYVARARASPTIQNN